MRHKTIQTVVALLLIVFGWAVGRAKTPAPEFTLRIEAPSGRTTARACGAVPCREVETRVIPTLALWRNIGSNAVTILQEAAVPQ